MAENRNGMNIYQKLSAITTELTSVAKNLEVETGSGKSYKAVSEGDVLAAVKPLEAKHGVYSYPMSRTVLSSEYVEKEGKYGKRYEVFMRVETTYRFVNMEKPEEFVDMISYGDGVDGQDKAPGKACTYSDKYSLLKAYKIITGDDPDQYASEDIKPVDNNKIKNKTDKFISANAAKFISSEIDQLGLDYEKIVKNCGANRVEEIKESKYTELVSWLEKKRNEFEGSKAKSKSDEKIKQVKIDDMYPEAKEPEEGYAEISETDEPDPMGKKSG